MYLESMCVWSFIIGGLGGVSVTAVFVSRQLKEATDNVRDARAAVDNSNQAMVAMFQQHPSLAPEVRERLIKMGVQV